MNIQEGQPNDEHELVESEGYSDEDLDQVKDGVPSKDKAAP